MGDDEGSMTGGQSHSAEVGKVSTISMDPEGTGPGGKAISFWILECKDVCGFRGWICH